MGEGSKTQTLLNVQEHDLKVILVFQGGFFAEARLVADGVCGSTGRNAAPDFLARLHRTR